MGFLKGLGKSAGAGAAPPSRDGAATPNANASPSTKPSPKRTRTPRTLSLLVGIRYDGLEQTFPVTCSELDTSLKVDVGMTFLVRYARAVTVSIYEVEPASLRVLRDWSGVATFGTFSEPSLRAQLAPHKSSVTAFDCRMALNWPAGEVVAALMTAEEIARIRLVNLTVKHARQIMPCDGATSDPFCEIFWYGEMVGKTKVRFRVNFSMPAKGRIYWNDES